MELEYFPKSDILFKMLFTRRIELLKSFLSAALSMPETSIRKLTVVNPEIVPQIPSGKFCRLDINLEVDEKAIDVEIQIDDEKNYRERSLYYWSDLFINALGKGQDYGNLPQTILINILDFNLFENIIMR